MESHTKMHSFEGPKTVGANDKPGQKKNVHRQIPLAAPTLEGPVVPSGCRDW